MNEFLMYLLKSACWLTGFALVYMIFLKNERFFILKRIFLISGIFVSLIFPLISIHYQVEVPAPQSFPVMLPQEPLPAPAGMQQDTARSVDYRLILLFVWLAGIALIGFRMVKQTISLYRSIHNNIKDKKESAIVVRSSDYPEAFSFINYVFINPSVNEHEAKEIMNHELVHVKQKHWLDLLLAELLRMLQWANPFAWIYTGFIRLNHEYLADEEALQNSSNPALYRAALINQLFDSPVISLSNSFNYSLNRKRFEMMKKIITSPYRKLKVLLILPVFALILYGFAKPEYHLTPRAAISGFTTGINKPDTLKPHPLVIIDGRETDLSSADGIDLSTIETKSTMPEETAVRVFGEKGKYGVIIVTTKKQINNPSPLKDKIIKEVKGTVVKEDGTPFSNVAIIVTGTQARSHSDESGSFTLADVPSASRILFSSRGYLTQVLKPAENLAVKMEKDPEYKEPVSMQAIDNFLLVINDVVSGKPYSQVRTEVKPEDIALMSVLKGDEAVKKYGEKAKNGVVEIVTRDKAREKGLPMRRTKPEDFPTFTGNDSHNFTQWLIDQLKYPAEAVEKNIQGRVSVSLKIQADGSVTDVRATGDPVLGEAVAAVVRSSPKWEPPVNPDAREPFTTGINLKFQLPDKIMKDDVFVVVEQMPQFPGGDAALLDNIRNNLRYPPEALEQKIEGRVIVRFVVSAKGTVESATVLKGVHPLLDAEALRLVNSLSGWLPGSQGGKPVDVWYMVPVTFALPGSEATKSFQSTVRGDAPFVAVEEMPMYPGGDGELLKKIAESVQYPQEAKDLKISGRVIVRFVVTKDGNTRDATVLKGVDPLLDSEALRVVNSLTGFKPGMQGGKPVDVYYMVPITFNVK